VIVRERADEYRCRFPSRHGDAVERIVLSLDEFRAHGEVGSSSEWNRYTFAHVEPAIDKLGGEIRAIAHEKETLPSDVARERVRTQLDTYINSYYRSAKNARAGLEAEAHLDAAESIPPLLVTLFALEGRVRPYNRFLRWELETHSLRQQFCEPEALVPRLVQIAGTGDLGEQQRLFRDAEATAREHGFGDVIEGWEPDVAWLRGEKV
jgi:hypothetical protein